MIRHIWTILARTIITDKETNLISYVNCIEEITTKNLPATLPTIGIGTLWEKDSNQAELLKLRISLIYPSGKSKEILKTEDISMVKIRHRLNILAGNLIVEEEGKHNIQVEILYNNNWDVVSKVPFFVNINR